MTEPTQCRLKSLLHYDPSTGRFIWTAARRGVRVGDECGRISLGHGYREIGIDCRLYRAHRLAFLYMLGRFPVSDVDHVNRDKADNAWANLREATVSQNMANIDVKPSNTSGYIGVTWDAARGKWRAQIRFNGRKKNLGRFAEPIEAARAHDAAAIETFGAFAHLNFPGEHADPNASGLRAPLASG